MLARIHIRNFALIEELDLELQDGFTVVTGETGSGKSIILDALGLALGDRADTDAMRYQDKKTIVEATFLNTNKAVDDVLKANDIDSFGELILRRELLPGGRTRAFVNDVPAQLNVLKMLSENLMDIHVQQQQAKLNDTAFRFNLLDGFAGALTLRLAFQEQHTLLLKIEKELSVLRANALRIQQERQMNELMLKEFEAIDLDTDESELVAELANLEYADGLKSMLTSALELAEDEFGALQRLTGIRNLLGSYRQVPGAAGLEDRMEHLLVEFKDVVHDMNRYADQIEGDPERLENLKATYDTLHVLYRRHMVSGIAELKLIKEELEKKLFQADNLDEELNRLEQAVSDIQKQCFAKADELHALRQSASSRLCDSVSELLRRMEMPGAFIFLELTSKRSLNNFGSDQLRILFSANQGLQPGVLEKTASGGERSRLMLALKAIMAKNLKVPTLVLDEIDNGVSGEVAGRMARVMHDMGNDMQLIAISHLPQIAARAAHHLCVSKHDEQGVTQTKVVALDRESRVQELATMLSGNPPSHGAIQNAKELLGN